MRKNLEIIKKCPLFTGIGESELITLLKCLSAVEEHYKKNSCIFLADEKVTSIGVVLSGGVRIVQENFWGNRTILSHIEPGGLFGEAFSCAEAEKLPVSVFAAEKTEIMLIDYRKIIGICTSACTFHTTLIKNMLRILANKNILLTQKIEIITQRTIRNKLMSYLSAQATLAMNNAFNIPFNRQELADYLSIDRSALSNELSKMRDEGILNFNRNHFELI